MDEVERLLQHPEDLKRLPNMLEEYSAKHAANKQAPAHARRCTCASPALHPQCATGAGLALIRTRHA